MHTSPLEVVLLYTWSKLWKLYYHTFLDDYTVLWIMASSYVGSQEALSKCVLFDMGHSHVEDPVPHSVLLG